MIQKNNKMTYLFYLCWAGGGKIKQSGQLAPPPPRGEDNQGGGGKINCYTGVPQGSFLGPLIFLIYTNDIVDDIHSCIRLFADDTSLYIIVDNPISAADELNADLAKMHAWAVRWLVSFNPAKSESMILSRKHNKPFHPPLSMNQNLINNENSHKHLGLIFSQNCSWYDHLELVKAKAWLRINVMRGLNFQLDRKSLQTIYISF